MQGVTKRCVMQTFLIECWSEIQSPLLASSSGESNSGAAKVHFNFSVVPKVLG